jgi:hypothetical protein
LSEPSRCVLFSSPTYIECICHTCLLCIFVINYFCIQKIRFASGWEFSQRTDPSSKSLFMCCSPYTIKHIVDWVWNSLDNDNACPCICYMLWNQCWAHYLFAFCSQLPSLKLATFFKLGSLKV